MQQGGQGERGGGGGGAKFLSESRNYVSLMKRYDLAFAHQPLFHTIVMEDSMVKWGRASE